MGGAATCLTTLRRLQRAAIGLDYAWVILTEVSQDIVLLLTKKILTLIGLRGRINTGF
jgi:hypothetical protein